ELFGGYPWRYLKGLKAETFGAFDDAYYQLWSRLVPPAELPKLFVPEVARYRQVPRERYAQVMAGAPPWQAALSTVDNMLQRALYFEARTFLHGLLVVEDRVSMAHSLETRVPFLDNALADLAWRLPPSLKLATEALARQDPNAHLAS